MHLRRISLSLLIAVVLLLSARSTIAKGTADVLPPELSVGIYVRMNSGDPGIQWILDSYKKNFLLGHLGDNAETVVEDFSVLQLEEASVALCGNLGESPKMVLVSDVIPADASITFRVKNVDFKLNIKERSEDKGLQSAVAKALLTAWVASPDKRFLRNDLAYSPSLEKEGKVCAYAVKDNRIIVGNDLGLVQGALGGSATTQPPQEQSTDLKDFLGRFAQPKDFFIYVNNGTGFLSQLNAFWEKKLQIPLVTSATFVRSAGMFADIVDKDRVELEGTILLDAQADLAATQQDTAFLLEFFRRKLLAEGVSSTYLVQAHPAEVRFGMSLTGTTPFLEKWLKKGRIKKPQTPL